jgi:hypothetical protein
VSDFRILALESETNLLAGMSFFLQIRVGKKRELILSGTSSGNAG